MMQRLVFPVVLLLLIPARGALAIRFLPLGDLPGGEISSVATGISGDGNTVIGTSRSARSTQWREAFRWTEQEGMVGLGGPSRNHSAPQAISFDSSVIAGYWSREAHLWSSELAYSGFGIGQLGSSAQVGVPGSSANGVSDDGAIIVGKSSSRDHPHSGEAFRWTASEGMQALGGLPGRPFVSSEAFNISGDGSTIVGVINEGTYSEAFRWTESGDMQLLDPLHDYSSDSLARSASRDGSVVVGQLNSRYFTPGFPTAIEAFRWTENEGMVGLGDLPGGAFDSRAIDVSADGSVIVGAGTSLIDNLNGYEAFRWDATKGMRNIREELILSGIDLSGWRLTAANGVSANGNIVVGFGINPGGKTEAWLADFTIPEPSTAALIATCFLAPPLVRQRR